MSEKQPEKTRFLANLALNERSRLLRTQERPSPGVPWLKTFRCPSDADSFERSAALETHLPRLGLEDKEYENRVILTKIKKAKEEFKRTLDIFHAKQNGFQKKALLLSFLKQREPSQGGKSAQGSRRGSLEPQGPEKHAPNINSKRSTYHDFEISSPYLLPNIEEPPMEFRTQDDLASTLDESGLTKLVRKLANLNAKIRKIQKMSEDFERTENFAQWKMARFNLDELRAQGSELAGRVSQEQALRRSLVAQAITEAEEQLAKVASQIDELNRFFQASKGGRRGSMQLTENKTGGLKESALRYINDEIDRIERALETVNSRSRSKLSEEGLLSWTKPPDWRFLMAAIFLALFIRLKNLDKDFLRSVCGAPVITGDKWRKVFGTLGSPAATALLLESLNGVLGGASPEKKLGLLMPLTDFLETSEQEMVRAGKFRSLKGITELLGRLERAHSLDRTPIIDFLMSDFPWQYFRNPTIVYFFLVNSSMFLTSQFRLCAASMSFVATKDRKSWETRGPPEVDVMAKINGMLQTSPNA